MKMSEIAKRWLDGMDTWATARRNVLEAITLDPASDLDVFEDPMRDEMLKEIVEIAGRERIGDGIILSAIAVAPSLSDDERTALELERRHNFVERESRYRDGAREWLRRRALPW